MSFDYIWFSATRNLIFFSHLKENRYLATSLVLSVLLSSDLPSLTLSANSWCCLQKNLMAHTVRQQKSSKFSLRPFLSIAQNEAAGAEALSELLQRTLQYIFLEVIFFWHKHNHPLNCDYFLETEAHTEVLSQNACSLK